MQRAARWPIYDCRISSFAGGGDVGVLMARDGGPSGIAAAMFIVDLGCVGVRKSYAVIGITPEDYQEVFVKEMAAEDFQPCDPALAAKVVQAGRRYAESLGLRTKLAHVQTELIFGSIDPATCTDEIPLGYRGKPYYRAWEDDDVRAVLRRLDERLPPLGYGFEIPWAGVGVDVWGLEESAESYPREDDPDPLARLQGRIQRAQDRLFAQVTKYAVLTLGPSFLDDAREAFSFGRLISHELEYESDRELEEEEDDEERDDTEEEDEDDEDDDFSDDAAVLPWSLFNWPVAVGKGKPRPIALWYLEAHRSRLDPFDVQLLENACRLPFTFYAVEPEAPGREGADVYMRDIFSGSRYRLIPGFNPQEPGIVFARLVVMDSLAVVSGAGRLVLPSGFEEPLTAARQVAEKYLGRALTEADVLDLDEDLRRVYWMTIDGLEDAET